MLKVTSLTLFENLSNIFEKDKKIFYRITINILKILMAIILFHLEFHKLN